MREEDLPTEARRIRAFASFFKNYMGVSAMVTAGLPIPITALNAIPSFSMQTNTQAVYTSMFCFLALAYIFYRRHALARSMFPNPDSEQDAKRRFRFSINSLPIILIGLSLAFIFLYHFTVETVVGKVHGLPEIAREMTMPQRRTFILENTLLTGGTSVILYFLYLGIFITAEAAFILMAIKEYIQDTLKLSDRDIILNSSSN